MVIRYYFWGNQRHNIRTLQLTVSGPALFAASRIVVEHEPSSSIPLSGSGLWNSPALKSKVLYVTAARLPVSGADESLQLGTAQCYLATTFSTHADQQSWGILASSNLESRIRGRFGAGCRQWPINFPNHFQVVCSLEMSEDMVPCRTYDLGLP